MKKEWIVSLRTTLPGTGCYEQHFKKSFLVFEEFEDARRAFREIINKYAFSENRMFDGNGHIKQLDNYIDDYSRGYKKEEINYLSGIRRNLETLFSGSGVATPAETDEGGGYWTDYYIASEYRNGVLTITGDNGDPCNKCDPTIVTNAFSMEKECNYYLYIDDRFGQDAISSKLFVDLAETSPSDWRPEYTASKRRHGNGWNCFPAETSEPPEKPEEASSEDFETVKFGRYPQLKDFRIKEIEWLVLEKKDGKALLISKYGLDNKPFNTEDEAVTWETCTLREWLNGVFLDTAFTDEEQERIVSSEVKAEDNPQTGAPAGNATTDKVFLLSISEAEKYFDSRDSCQCRPTEYCKKKGGGGRWWLRSPGYKSKYSTFAAIFTVDRLGRGYVIYSGDLVNTFGDNVRPAMWVKLNKND